MGPDFVTGPTMESLVDLDARAVRGADLVTDPTPSFGHPSP